MALDPSFEKLSQAQSGSQIAIWNEGKSWLAPIQYYSKVSTSVRASSNSDAERRFLFFRWEVETLIAKRFHDSEASVEDSIKFLNLIFFSDLGFKCSLAPASPNRGSERFLPTLDAVLARRSGPPSLIAILYAWVGELVVKSVEAKLQKPAFSRIELVASTPTEVVRIIPSIDRGEVWLMDLSKQGEQIDEIIWSEWCSNSNSGFQRLTWAQGMIRSLTDLFRAFEADPTPTLENLTSQLFVLDQIMSLQPSETRRWADRARLNARRGDKSGALDDLKRFFAFHDRDSAPTTIVALYDTLRS